MTRFPCASSAETNRASGEIRRVLQQFRSCRAGRAETPLAAVGLYLFRLGVELLRLLLAEILDGAGRTEESERVVDRADVFLQFLQECFGGGLLAVLSDGVEPRLGGGSEGLGRRGDERAGGFDEFLFRHGRGSPSVG